jgi:hypothetical protein
MSEALTPEQRALQIELNSIQCEVYCMKNGELCEVHRAIAEAIREAEARLKAAIAEAHSALKPHPCTKHETCPECRSDWMTALSALELAIAL